MCVCVYIYIYRFANTHTINTQVYDAMDLTQAARPGLKQAVLMTSIVCGYVYIYTDVYTYMYTTRYDVHTAYPTTSSSNSS